MKLVANLKKEYKGMINSQSITLCISNGGQYAKNETNMNKINNGAIIVTNKVMHLEVR